MIRRRILKFVARDLLVEILAADTEYARALSFVTPRCRQHLGDISRFHLREAGRLLFLSLRGDRCTQPSWQVVRVNRSVRGNDDRSLDNVSELARVTGIVISLQQREGRLRYSIDFPRVLRCVLLHEVLNQRGKILLTFTQ